ncbi:MAG: phosphoadenosine phosphosulfate reductase [Salibacteraceae bacterium]|jgi:phosphoadenosine phosphosulfate reductase
MNLESINAKLRTLSPSEIVEWAFSLNKKTVITTNFRPYESAILHAVSAVKQDTTVIWCDTGYNTTNTYSHAQELIDRLQLNIDLFVPQQTVGNRNVTMGIPDINDPNHAIFTEQVKLEPFARAMKEHKPEVWFTNLRKEQTAFRNSIDIVSLSKDGVIKVSPFYHFSDTEMDSYLTQNNLPNEFDYYDPTKVLDNRECGLHN